MIFSGDWTIYALDISRQDAEVWMDGWMDGWKVIIVIKGKKQCEHALLFRKAIRHSSTLKSFDESPRHPFKKAIEKHAPKVVSTVYLSFTLFTLLLILSASVKAARPSLSPLHSSSKPSLSFLHSTVASLAHISRSTCSLRTLNIIMWCRV